MKELDPKSGEDRYNREGVKRRKGDPGYSSRDRSPVIHQGYNNQEKTRSLSSIGQAPRDVVRSIDLEDLLGYLGTSPTTLST